MHAGWENEEDLENLQVRLDAPSLKLFWEVIRAVRVLAPAGTAHGSLLRHLSPTPLQASGIELCLPLTHQSRLADHWPDH